MNLRISALALAKSILTKILSFWGYLLIKERDAADYFLHDYGSYEEYRRVQIFHNKRKIDNVWADESTLKRVVTSLTERFEEGKIRGLCHGTRNGFEQNYLRSACQRIEAIGTDISDTANNYEYSAVWDFHDERSEWTNSNQFVYTNSLDQSWQPKKAITVWLNQLTDDGVLLIEHTEQHGPKYAGEMDPFGVRPTAVPYVLTMWFGSQIMIKHSVAEKSNNGYPAWLFEISKNTTTVDPIT